VWNVAGTILIGFKLPAGSCSKIETLLEYFFTIATVSIAHLKKTLLIFHLESFLLLPLPGAAGDILARFSPLPGSAS
jgi:hypothetical protein